MASSKRQRELTTNPGYGTPEQPSGTRRKLTNVPSIVIVPNGSENHSISRVGSYLVGGMPMLQYPPSDTSPVTPLDTPNRDFLNPFQGVADENRQMWSPSPSPPRIHTLSLGSDIEMDLSVAGKLITFSVEYNFTSSTN